MSLRSKILVLFMVFTAFPLLFLGLGDYAQSVNALQIIVQERTVSNASLAASGADARLVAMQDSVEALARSVGNAGDLELLVGVEGTEGRVELAGMFDRLSVEDANGRSLASTMLDDGSAVCGPAAGEDPIVASTPLPGRPDLRLVGSSAPGKLLRNVPGLNAQLGRDGHLLLLDPGTGHVVHSAACQDVGRTLAGILGVPRVVLEPGGASRLETAENPTTLAVQAMERAPWVVAATASDSEFIEPFTALRRNYLLLVLGMVLGAAAAAYVVLRRSFLTLDRLAAAADEVGQGNLSPWLPPPGDDEAGRLALAFGRMTHRLTVSVRQAELSQKMAAVGELASYLSHEIRNPLSSIKLNLQSLARDARAGVTPDDFPRVVELCLSEVERLNSVVYTVLDLGRDRQRDGPVAHCSAHEVVHAALDLLRPRLERAGIEVQEDLAVQESTVRADADRLKGVIINLVVNACDAMPEGGRIRIRTRAAMDEGGAPRLCIHVADEGPGIPPHLREAIFQPFFTTKADGNGIGLSTAAATASEWGGSIEFRKDSELVPGAEFVLSLVPVQATGAPDAGNGRRSTSHRRRLHGTGLVHAATDAKLAADEGNR